MTSTVISLKCLYKKYKLYNSRKDHLKEAFSLSNKKYHKEFLALKNINLDIEAGITLGIVGRNGSGKSTLLQVICSILKPTSGSVHVTGRISALLELGGGFNLDLTGRENILWMGLLMGFSSKEMEKKIPEIEAFSELGEFIDQPVKTYSTGMFLRLGFATAVNVDPNILIIDEALSVGDAKFQHKCYQKFRYFQEQGNTILLVTHDSNLILKHCDRAILLDSGNLLEVGEPNDVVNKYLDLLENRHPSQKLKPKVEKLAIQGATETNEEKKYDLFLSSPYQGDICSQRNGYNKNEYRQCSEKVEIFDYLLTSEDKEDINTIVSGQTLDIYLKVFFHHPIEVPHFGFAIKSTEGIVIFGYNTSFSHSRFSPAKKSEICVFKFSQKINLHQGDYFIDLGVDEGTGFESVQSVDRRCSIIHLSVLENKKFDGLVDLETSFEKIDT